MAFDKDGTLDTAGISDVDIRIVDDENLPLDTGLEFHPVKDDPLFNDPLTIRDAIQIGIADCFMIAGLHSLIDIRPEAILGSMKDLGDGWVDVRIFEGGAAKYYRVEKTIVKRKEANLQGHEALWPHFVEKAFAKWRLDKGYKFSPDLVSGGAKQVASTYAQALSGGTFGDFLTAIIGSYSQLEAEIHTEGGNTSHRAAIDFLQLTAIRKRSGGLVAREAAAITRIFHHTLEPDALENLFACNKALRDASKFVGQFLGDDETWRQEKILKFLNDQYGNLLPGTRDALDTFIKTSFPGKRGSGVYSQQQRRLFGVLQATLDKNLFVGLGTKPNIAKIVSGRAGTGEAEKAGLAGPHAYSVTGLARYQEGTAPCVLFIRLRNPWLRVVRQYRWKEKKFQGHTVRVLTPSSMEQLDLEKFMTRARFFLRDEKYDHNFTVEGSARSDIAEGEFWLELSDLTKRFIKLSVVAEKDPEKLLAALQRSVDNLNEMPEAF